ncbi:hybrid sensor histidine kinase/response regulator [Rhizobium sp. L1K21]|uniref:hybrid sensor histidine kinase/response regulator n=1 Tax=Rhizobium sp. L1K21 TaxID=2954933 RepID=UPI0020936CAF|nr:hybrid sensor histidine kinase/response regulator [Rhizobium sp. L1K21]MCO6188300.1 ATP-binding protein [Rhizobium sp. L1K21]
MDAGARLGILIIDDDMGDRKSLRRALAKSGLECAVHEAEGVSEALSAIGENQVDCIFLDYDMPLLDGLEGIENLKAKAPEARIIMVTGQGDELLATRAMKSGADEYIPKRFVSVETVRKAVTHVMEIAHLERQIREQQEALSSFSRMLAHDLKAPVRHVRIVGEGLVQALEEKDVERAQQLFGMMGKMVDRIGLLVSTLDEYNKSLSPNVSFGETDLSAACDAALENLRIELDQAGAEVKRADLPLAWGNEALLIQLFQNLVGNAIKFCRGETPQVSIHATEENGVFTVSVKDNGIGIDPKHASLIFEPFKRLNPIGEFVGTGLGLATCKKIVDRHGGEIWVESTLGKGATFCFTLKTPSQ